MGRDAFHNGGSYCRTERVLGNTTAETETDGLWIDRQATDKGVALSAKLVVNYSAVLADTDDTLTLAVTFQDASDSVGTGAADVYSSGTLTVDTANSGGETVVGTAEIDVDLSAFDRFLRAQITLVGEASGSVAYSANIVLFGDHRQPSTSALSSLGGAASI